MNTLDQFTIKGRSALVTGAASGIGLAYAEAMAEAGVSACMTKGSAGGGSAGAGVPWPRCSAGGSVRFHV